MDVTRKQKGPQAPPNPPRLEKHKETLPMSKIAYSNLSEKERESIVREYEVARGFGSYAGHATGIAAKRTFEQTRGLTVRGWNGKAGEDAFAAAAGVLLFKGYLESADADKHNGWSNRPTWLVHLWLTNDPYTYELAASMSTESDLREFVECLCLGEEPAAGLAMDLLTDSLGSVDWSEILEALEE